jgi:hypothetical protein
MLIGDGKDEKKLNDAVGVVGRCTLFINLLDKVVPTSERFPLLSRLLSTVAVLSTRTTSLERGLKCFEYCENKFGSPLEENSMNDLMVIKKDVPSFGRY